MGRLQRVQAAGPPAVLRCCQAAPDPLHLGGLLPAVPLSQVLAGWGSACCCRLQGWQQAVTACYLALQLALAAGHLQAMCSRAVMHGHHGGGACVAQCGLHT